MRSFSLCALAFILVDIASAKQVVVTVGGNTTDNAATVFKPASVAAEKGDTVVFTFTKGNHTATQSTFANPCVPAHDTNSTINSFDSSFRDAGNGTAITSLSVTIADKATIWFFDYNTCDKGGVGGININDSSLETLDGFQRNAVRLNSSEPSSSASSASRTSTATAAGSTASSNDATHTILLGGAAVIPVLVAVLSL